MRPSNNSILLITIQLCYKHHTSMQFILPRNPFLTAVPYKHFLIFNFVNASLSMCLLVLYCFQLRYNIKQNSRMSWHGVPLFSHSYTAYYIKKSNPRHILCFSIMLTFRKTYYFYIWINVLHDVENIINVALKFVIMLQFVSNPTQFKITLLKV